MDYTWEYDGFPWFGKRVVVILTTRKLDPEEIIHFAYQIGAFLSEDDNEDDLFFVKMPDEFDSEALTEDEVYSLWE
ncbi:MAG: hypothetical protein NTY30_01600 [Candidatus Berkelbacteria bacterium]|nr:hypothetical protein [Candidatus Berkelbacteria bacterium]